MPTERTSPNVLDFKSGGAVLNVFLKGPFTTNESAGCRFRSGSNPTTNNRKKHVVKVIAAAFVNIWS
jgi:hypothetical protein